MLIQSARISGNELILTLPNPLEAARQVHKFKAGEYDLIKCKRKRSLDANNLMWTFCEQIARRIGSTKEDVYREQIRQVGVYYPLPIRADAVDSFSRDWQRNGIGWFVDVVDDSKIPGYKLCFAYKGSSQYDTAEMSRLIDNVLQDAESIGIDTISDKERGLLLDAWAYGGGHD